VGLVLEPICEYYCVQGVESAVYDPRVCVCVCVCVCMTHVCVYDPRVCV